MVRTQVQLPEEQYRQLKRWAARLGISFAEAVRRCVSERLAAETSASGHKAMVLEAFAVLGKYEDPEGLTTVAVDHDQNYQAWYPSSI